MVVDTSVLLNFIHLDRLDLFGDLPAYTFVICDQVNAEVVLQGQRSILASALSAGHLGETAADSPDQLELFIELSRTLDPGESASLAVAVSLGWLVAVDERAAQREADRRLGTGRCITTPGVIVEAIRAGLVSIEEADRMKGALALNKFKMTFRSFRDVM